MSDTSHIPSGVEATDLGNQALADAVGSTFRLLRRLMVLVGVLYLLSGITVIEQHQQAFVLHFGRVQAQADGDVLGPGFHWTWPRPFAEVVKIDATRVRSLDLFTFWSDPQAGMADLEENGEIPQAYTRLDPIQQGYFITGDANILHGVWSLRYRVSDPRLATFGFTDLERLLRFELQHAITLTASNTRAGDALRAEVERFRLRVEESLAVRLQAMAAGIHVERVEFVRPSVPPQVIEAFNDVVKAENEREKQITEARAYSTRQLNEAQGQAARLLAEARAQQLTAISRVQSAARLFQQLAARHKENPEIVEAFIRQEAYKIALHSAEDKFFLRENREGEQEIRIQLSKEPRVKKGTP